MKKKWVHIKNDNKSYIIHVFAPLTGAVKYTDCTSAEGYPPTSNECPDYDTKQSDGEVPVMLGPWGIWSAPSLPLLSGQLWPGVVASDRTLSMGLIELMA